MRPLSTERPVCRGKAFATKLDLAAGFVFVSRIHPLIDEHGTIGTIERLLSSCFPSSTVGFEKDDGFRRSYAKDSSAKREVRLHRHVRLLLDLVRRNDANETYRFSTDLARIHHRMDFHVQA